MFFSASVSPASLRFAAPLNVHVHAFCSNLGCHFGWHFGVILRSFWGHVGVILVFFGGL